MKKILMLILAATLIIAAFCGCGAVAPANETGEIVVADYGRFSETFYATNISVITDTQTGSQYLVYRSANGTGLTMMDVEG